MDPEMRPNSIQYLAEKCAGITKKHEVDLYDEVWKKAIKCTLIYTYAVLHIIQLLSYQWLVVLDQQGLQNPKPAIDMTVCTCTCIKGGQNKMWPWWMTAHETVQLYYN